MPGSQGDARPERRSACPTEGNRRDASSARSDEGAYREYVTEERRSDATQIGDFTTEGKPFVALEVLSRSRPPACESVRPQRRRGQGEKPPSDQRPGPWPLDR